MRASACLAVLAATNVAAHPLCFFDDRPTDYDVTLGYCDNSIAPSGACCTSEEEAALSELVDAAFAEGVVPSDACFELYKEVGRLISRALFSSRSGCVSRTPLAVRPDVCNLSVGEKWNLLNLSLFFFPSSALLLLVMRTTGPYKDHRPLQEWPPIPPRGCHVCASSS